MRRRAEGQILHPGAPDLSLGPDARCAGSLQSALAAEPHAAQEKAGQFCAAQPDRGARQGHRRRAPGHAVLSLWSQKNLEENRHGGNPSLFDVCSAYKTTKQ